MQTYKAINTFVPKQICSNIWLRKGFGSHFHWCVVSSTSNLLEHTLVEKKMWKQFAEMEDGIKLKFQLLPQMHM